ncbi:MAG: hypothetical protein ACREHV_14740, partial [Rhizomicrobium sp.]
MTRAVKTHNRKRAPIGVADLGCSYLINECARILLRPLPGSSFELVAKLDPRGGAITLPNFARQHALAPKTLH